MELWHNGKAICYSGYREGQSPRTGICPSYDEVLQDLKILVNDGYRYIRMYEPNAHARTALRVIRDEKLPLKVMLGIDPKREFNNIGCPWIKETLSASHLQKNAAYNDRALKKLITLANEYRDEICCVSVGNENRPSWGSDLVTSDRLVEFAIKLKAGCEQPVTYNEGTSEWLHLEKLVDVIDIISIHSYPLWNGVSADKALAMNKDDYRLIKNRYPGKEVIFTECGWATKSNSSAMKTDQVNERTQVGYIKSLWKWTEEEGITVFIFEAFDEPWKGSEDDDEPEKHWGIYNVDRTKKLAWQEDNSQW
ncbi:MAG: hypothetical protein J6Y89_08540 [Lachnospiraceae bacterium]|nr:hypothetical protein [Lachnospiraceae bacterium]